LSAKDKQRWSDEVKSFRERKGPDFKSRLAAYLNVAGPNPRRILDWRTGKSEVDTTDTGYPLRRALMLRSQFGLKDAKPLDIDPRLLTAFLEIEEYRHGARSIEKIVEQIKAHGNGSRCMPSQVPPDELLDLHVDAMKFRDLLERDDPFQLKAEKIAPFIHAAYLEGADPADRTYHDVVRKAYDRLSTAYQEDNIAAARRMTDVLASVGLSVVPAAGRDTSKEVRVYLERHIETLSDAEHRGWIESKLKDGWSYDKTRNDARKLHDCLLAFGELPREQQDKDRNTVRRYPDFANHAGYRIEFRSKPKPVVRRPATRSNRRSRSSHSKP
jgi:hypothetical protein